MSKLKIENWNGCEIRFIEVDGKWYAVLKDVCDALGLRAKKVSERLEDKALKKGTLTDVNNRPHEYLLVNEYGIYKTIFRSNKPEAEQFQLWVFDVISQLREAAGLEGFQVFRMLDKEHQKTTAKMLHEGLKSPTQLHHQKLNTIVDKAVSNIYGLKKMIKKGDMTPQMLLDRQPILEEAAELMVMQDKYGVPEHIAPIIYERAKENYSH